MYVGMRTQKRLCCYKKSVSIYKKSEKSMKLMSENLEKLKSTENENKKTS